MQDAMKKISIYSRKSRFTGKGESIGNQIELCRQYIHTHFPDTGEGDILIYEDEGFSGGNTERPQFKKMMADAGAHRFSAIVCYRLDRISRNIGDFARLIGDLETYGIAFISIKEQFDTSSPMGRAMMYISSVFSQLERETIAERIRDNMYGLARTGRWLGGTTPTGYASESVETAVADGKIKKACNLKIIPDEAELIRLIFTKFLESNSLTKTETYLIQNAVTTKRGNLYTRFALKNILTNPVYMIADKDAYGYFTKNKAGLFASETDFGGEHGVMAYNRTLQKPGHAHQTRPMDEWIVTVGRHTGIISGADWVRVQENLEQNRSKSYRKPRSNAALLSGLLFCGNCGGYMRPKLSRRLNAQGEPIYSYLCSMKEKSRRQSCNIDNASGNTLDKVLCDEIKKLGEDVSVFIRRLEEGKPAALKSNRNCGAELARLRRSAQENEREAGALAAALAKAAGSASEDYILKAIERLHENSGLLRLRIAELEGLTAGRSLSGPDFDALRKALTSFKGVLDNMSIEQKRAALRSLIRKTVWDGVSAHIYLYGSDDSGGTELPDELRPDKEWGAEPSWEDSK